MHCLDDQTVAALVSGAIEAGERAAIEGHLDGCAACRRLVAAVAQLSAESAHEPSVAEPSSPEPSARAPVAPAAQPLPLAPGARIGRYVVQRLLGAGGVGYVLAAYDAELDRRVAIKLLRRPGGLRREALALARLQHPNVVAVHELGVHDGHEFIVMELVDGETAATWLAAPEPRSVAAIVDLFVAAGRGLAAVHDAGLVHRDFKPSNILVGRDGRVRLGDLGLAAAAPHPPGVVAGTPAYMAPEQRRGEPVDARSDQVGFCVALTEALTGARPGLDTAPHRPMPRSLRAIVERGLADDPAARHSSMAALLDAIERSRGSRRKRELAVVSVLALAAAGFVGSQARHVSVPPPCGAAPSQLAAVWSADRRVHITEALVASRRPHAAHTAELVAAGLDRWGDGWQRGATDACRATRVSGEQSEALLDRRMGCYRRLLGSADEALRFLGEHPSPEIVDKAQEVVAGLPTPAACADIDRLDLPAPATVRDHVAALDRELARAQAMQRAGRYQPALALTDSLAAEIGAVGFAPLSARHLALRGQLLGETKDRLGEVEGTLAAALTAAARAGDDGLAAEIWTSLVRITGSIAGRADEALGRRPFAEAAVLRAGDPPLLRAGLDQGLALVELARHDSRAATPLLAEALALRNRALGEDSALAGTTRQLLCKSLTNEGKLAEAVPHCVAALATLETALGAEHPAVASALLDLADLAVQRGQAAEAVSFGRRGLDIRRRTYGDDHPATAIALLRLAQVHLRQHQILDAKSLLEEALVIDEKTFGREDPRTAQALELHAWCLREIGSLYPAREELERVLAVQRKAWGDKHVETARTLADLGDVERRAGRFDAARKHLDEALAAYEQTVGRAHPALAAPLGYLGELELAAAKPAGALPFFERALALPDVEPLNDAQLRFGLARALWLVAHGRGSDHDRALALAREARSAYQAAPGFSEEEHEVAAWLAPRAR